jgi:integrase
MKMANLRKQAKGGWEIRFTDDDERRVSLYLGVVPARSAEEILRHVERMLEAKWANRPLDETTAKWVGGVDGRLRDKLVAKGLIAPIERPKVVLLGAFIEQCIQELSSERAPRTVINLRQARDKLLAYVPAEREMGSVTVDEMVRYRHWLATACGLAPNSVKIHCKKAKQFFGEAVSRGLIPDNPCRTLKDLHEMRNEERERFMEIEEALRVLAACPSAEWRLIFSLARFGGLRRSEILALRWEHIVWNESRIDVPGAKGRHGTGKRKRDLPIFPELATALRAVLAERPQASGRIVVSYSPSANIGVPMARIIHAAGIEGWQKCFQNLRATRATELITAGKDPATVCRWLGHSLRVFLKHYHRMRREDFQQAAALHTLPVADRPPAGLLGAPEGAREPSQVSPPVTPALARMTRAGKQGATFHFLTLAPNLGNSATFASVRPAAQSRWRRRVLPTGIEPVTFSSGG